jgi:hypothetical protein
VSDDVKDLRFGQLRVVTGDKKPKWDTEEAKQWLAQWKRAEPGWFYDDVNTLVTCAIEEIERLERELKCAQET